MGMPNDLNSRFTMNDVGGASFVLATEDSNAIVVSIQLYDRAGRELQKSVALDAYLSSASDGSTFEGHSGTLTIASGTDGLTIPAAAANSSGHSLLKLVSEADGDIDVSITQTSGADEFYLVLIMPNGDLVISQAITFAA